MISHLSGVTTTMCRGHGHTRRAFIVNSGRALLIGAGIAAGLGRTRVAGAASQVTIGLASVPCQAPTYAAVAQGYFNDEGMTRVLMSPFWVSLRSERSFLR